ncbi:glycosyltransferase [Corynebacterium sp. FDAARGOS 1242]|uniref:glycosyltransferase n=1 Tax=Corynebacterium sp. FDAARGOS 1242 TaxID=2778078 RepID=UPI00194ECE65|nr:glycosyltransferase [Corynebacterium sp. FDAARGOS 1242]QRP98355.1 glycosyltransferase [Corynebacterium sp. FDAARGOS 1242]
MAVQKIDELTRPLDGVSLRENVSPGQKISLFVETVSEDDRSRLALVAFKFLDSDGEPIEDFEWSRISEAVGFYSYLSPSVDGKPVQDRLDIIVPPKAVVFEAVGKQWRKGKNGSPTMLLGDFQFQTTSDGVAAFRYPSGKPATLSSSEFIQRITLDSSARELTLSATYIPSKELKNIAPLSVRFMDSNGNELLGTTDLPQNPRFGSFIGLPAGESIETKFERTIEIPKGATALEIAGVDWGNSRAAIVGPFESRVAQDQSFSIRDFIRQLGRETPLMIIDTTAPPLGHETLSLRPNNLAAAYSRLGIGVVFIPFGSLQEYPAMVSDKLAQIPRADFNELLEVVTADRTPENSTFICSSFPSIQSVTAVQRLKTAGWTTVYECRDDMEEFNRVGYSKWYDPQLERQMLRMVDTVVSVSAALDEKLVSLYPALERHFIVPNAVNKHVIDSTRELRSTEVTAQRNASRKVGYVGHLTESWFDWPLVVEAAKRLPDVTFQIVGHGMPKGIRLPKNVEFLGAMNHDELRPLVKTWKAGLIPFADIPLTRSVDPNKIYEYFAWGLRCVTAPMGMVHEYPSTWVYRGVDEFIHCIESALDSELTYGEIETLTRFLESASWDDRAREMLEIMKPGN